MYVSVRSFNVGRVIDEVAAVSGSVVFMFGTLNEDTPVLQLKGQATNISHVAAEDLPVVHGLEGDGVVKFS